MHDHAFFIFSTEGDPHFTVPLLSKNILCYSIQGYSGLAFNLIYNKHFVINALFVDTEGDTSEATWIGKLSVVPQRSNAAVVFDSVNQEVVIVGKGNLRASMVKQIIFTENGTVKFTQRMQKKSGNSVIRVIYTNPEARFDVTYYNNHLNVDWSIRYNELHDSHGLMGMNCIQIIFSEIILENFISLSVIVVLYLCRRPQDVAKSIQCVGCSLD